MGLAVAASPQPGWYGTMFSAHWSNKLIDKNGEYSGHSGETTNTSFALMWVPKTKVLGATYRAFVSLPVIRSTYEREAPFTPESGRGKGHDTSIGNVEFVFIPNGGYDVDKTINSQTDFIAFGTHLGFSYLRNGWNISTFLALYNSQESDETKYKSGDEILLNFGALKEVGGLSVGPVGYWRKQIESDKNRGSYYGGTIAAKSEQIGLGLGVSTRIYGMQTNVNFTYDVHSRAALRGPKIWFRISKQLSKS
jgi:hypothetical protein